jgi:hypothetical protein
MQHKPRNNYDVGYCRPPKEHQFKPGQGRKVSRGPRKLKGILQIFQELVSEKIKINIGEEQRVMTRGEAVMYANHQKALKSDQKAMHNLFHVIEEGGLFSSHKSAETDVVHGLGIRKMTPEERKAYIEKHGGEDTGHSV